MKRHSFRVARCIPYSVVLLLMALFYGGICALLVMGPLTTENGCSKVSGTDACIITTISITFFVSIPSFLLGIGLVVLQAFQEIVSPVLLKLPFLIGALFPVVSLLEGGSLFFLWFVFLISGAATITTLFFGYHDLVTKLRQDFNVHDKEVA